jgi:YbbR domain-containing protein
VTRALGFLVRNWPLKLAAVVLATLLYAGLVLSQNARFWPGPIPIQVIHQPTSAFIVGALPDVTNVRYFAAVDVSNRLSSSAFAASIDLADANVNVSEPVPATVTLRGPEGVTILDFTPRQIFVRLDPLVTRTVPVRVSHGVAPEGLDVGQPQMSQDTVSVSGPQSVVSQVVAAEARVRIQSSGIDVDQLVDLVAVDGRDEVLTPVELNPTAVRVRIQVGSPVTTKSVPVTAVVTGTPGNGFEIAGTTITPAVATLTGEATVLANIVSVSTNPVDITGAASNSTTSVGLDLPSDISPVGDATFNVTITLRPSAASRNLSAGLILIGAEPNRTYALAVESVVVTLGGGLSALNAVDAGTFAASINVAGLGAGSHDVDVHVVAPPGLKLISVSPPRVTVFVGATATPPPTPSPTPAPSPTPEPSAAAASGSVPASESPAASGSP